MKRKDKAIENFTELFNGEVSFDAKRDPDFAEVLKNFVFGDVYEVGRLNKKIRELIVITCLTIIEAMPQLKSHVKAALNVGCKPISIRETIYQTAPLIGFPRTINALNIMNDIFEERNIALPLKSIENEALTKYDKEYDSNVVYSSYEEDYDSLVKDYLKIVPAITTDFVYTNFLARKGLNRQARMLLYFAGAAALGNAPYTLKRYYHLCRRVDVPKEDLMATLIQIGPYVGMPVMLKAFHELSGEFSE